jgi:hypothetical protein
MADTRANSKIRGADIGLGKPQNLVAPWSASGAQAGENGGSLQHRKVMQPVPPTYDAPLVILSLYNKSLAWFINIRTCIMMLKT